MVTCGGEGKNKKPTKLHWTCRPLSAVLDRVQNYVTVPRKNMNKLLVDILAGNTKSL